MVYTRNKRQKKNKWVYLYVKKCLVLHERLTFGNLETGNAADTDDVEALQG
jgi:hypothetical protein